MEMKQTKKRIVLWIAAGVMLVALICLGIYLQRVAAYKQAVGGMTFGQIDLTAIADGTYVGECDVQFIYAKVEVTVEAGVITDIAILEHRNDRGQAAEVVIDRMVAEQTIDVDTISGATNSSTVLKKAVEHALLQ